MLGLMQTRPLLVSGILTHAARNHPHSEVVSCTAEGALHRCTYVDIERRARRLVRALQRLGIADGDRVATLAWNGHRHLEIYYAVSGMGAIVHTVNPRLAPADIVHIVNEAEDRVLFADAIFAPLLTALAPHVAGSVRAVVLMTDAAHMLNVALAPGIALYCYETLLDEADANYDWPLFDENTASALCYTSGTTGRPKGVLYTHRSTWLHANAVSLPDAFGLRAVDRVLPVVPMFHVNGWGIPYAAPLVGASLVMPGRHLDGASLHALIEGERVTFTAGVPTVWLGLLQHLRATGGRMDTLERLGCGGSACPPMLIEAFGREYDVRVIHAWGMTESSPVGMCYGDKPGFAALQDDEAARLRRKQGCALPGIEMRIVDGVERELPWDGQSFGHLQVRGPWVLRRYFGADEDATTAEDWFATGDVATIDPHGLMEITDRTKDIVKSGGEWISSIALECIAASHPDVAEAAVIATRHPKWDERPLLIVVAREGRAIDRDGLLQWFDGKVAKWWIPEDVAFVAELPHSATGKVNKVALRQQFREYVFETQPNGDARAAAPG